ncbi:MULTISPECIES: CII family transcriptional regulator [unclassified Bradyrhizobium]|uniref:CII family transcriptional regulator n=1 Tax=unclassified Bradyrhizobium TaxID=2631580 RepID=UPI0033984997
MARKKTANSKQTIDLSGLNYPTGDMWRSYWFDLRDQTYFALRGRSIPGDLIDAARRFDQHSQLAWNSLPNPNESLREGDYEIEDLGSEEGQQVVQSTSTSKPPKTVGEALAFCLSMELSKLKGAQNAPVRAGGLLPRSTIALVAYDLLSNYDVTSPGPYLMELISDLLGISQLRDENIEEYTSRERAAYILAQAPHVSSEEAAKAVGVNRTSISRWKKDPRFQERVLQVREVLKSRRSKPPSQRNEPND